MIKISIILPCYNVSQYIRRCLDSILLQDFDDFEIIIINDGSTDDLIDVCRSYIEDDERIKLYTFDNQGLSQARNEGLLRANGEYVYFCDPDDYINPKTLRTIYNKAKEDNYDAVHFGFKTIYEDQGGINYNTVEQPLLYTDNKSIIKYYMPKFLGTTQEDINTWVDFNYLWKERKQFSSVWRFLYKRELLIKNNIFFYKGVKLFEDKLFNACFFCYAESICIIDGVFYNYFIREKGLLTSALSEDNALVEDKINGVIQRERVRELYQKIHDIDIFDCYIGTIVFSALEIIVKLSVLSPIRSYKLYCKPVGGIK